MFDVLSILHFQYTVKGLGEVFSVIFMTSSLVIDSIENVGNGLHALVSLDGTPTGTLTFYTSRIPGSANATVTTYTGAGPYVVEVSHPSIWYIYAHDDNGFTSDPTLAVVISDDPNSNGAQYMDEVGRLLTGIIEANIPGIEAALRVTYPGATVKTVQYGGASGIIAYPSICVDNPTSVDREFATGWVREMVYGYRIQCLVTHEDEASALPYAMQMADAIKMLLNQPAYETLTTPSGFTVDFGWVSNVSGSEAAYGEAFQARSQLSWGVKGTYQDCPGVQIGP